MKIASKVIVISTLLFIPVATAISPEATLIVEASVQKVMWGKTELVVGQIGKVTILKDTPLVQVKNGKLVTVRTLKKGDQFRVYQYKSDNGGMYGVGGGSFVVRNTANVKYETPSKANLALLAKINGETKPVTSPPTQTVGSIKAQYGKHVYGSKSQAEYDAVVKEAKAQLAKFKMSDDTINVSYLDRYIAGERPSGGGGRGSTVDRELGMIHSAVGSLVANGVSKADILKLVTSADVDGTLREGAKDPKDGSPRSAYDAMFRGLDDCDPTAEVQSLVFDIQGYSTMIVAGNNHASLYVKVQGKWYAYGSGSFLVADKDPSVLASGTYIMSQPTF
ncbi:hypothetical protein [Psychrobacillus psychrodurans]|uniref:Uncharacterized protein n=1 Tax=Psychrobacillus psychrodurans TaxID=126157 RepID=A0A9X3L949_9BACI|nr:hypothetical protein [Psychrobacillus psychrodurans]MCZ8533539.1 hypothetical protein [Psychrobacillus psychrodurans]